jgi:DNA polymerase-3 subunit epsilon
MWVLDLETTGLSPQRDSIVELGMVSITESAIVDRRRACSCCPIEYNRMFRVSPFDRGGNARDLGTRFHGIGWTEVSASATLRSQAPRIAEMLDGATWIGHNIRRFDAPFLIEALRRVGYSVQPSRIIDTLERDRMMRPDRGGVRTPHNLRSACEAWGLPWIGKQHRALDDAAMTAELAIRQASVIGWGGR